MDREIEQEGDFRDLIERACSLGADKARVIRSVEIPIKDELAGFCREPRCQSYGLSASCPPYVSGPAGFRELIKTCPWAIVFIIDVPWDIFMSADRLELAPLVHEIASSTERSAIEKGYGRSRSFAGGGCKRIFCSEYKDCRVVSGRGECRNPNLARPSMSGFGIDVSNLVKAAGLTMNRIDFSPDRGETSMGTVCGLILVG